MNELDTLSNILRRSGDVPLETMLVALLKYGKPRISHDGFGWYCAVEMYVAAKGVNFKVASDFSNPTPSHAVKQCAERLATTVRDFGGPT